MSRPASLAASSTLVPCRTVTLCPSIVTVTVGSPSTAAAGTLGLRGAGASTGSSCTPNATGIGALAVGATGAVGGAGGGLGRNEVESDMGVARDALAVALTAEHVERAEHRHHVGDRSDEPLVG